MSILRQIGTRTIQQNFNSHPPEGDLDRGMQQDPGMNKRVVVSTTFTASNNRATAAASTFTNFAVGDVVVIEGTNLNNSIQTVIATDASTYLQLDQGVANEGPVTATIRAL